MRVSSLFFSGVMIAGVMIAISAQGMMSNNSGGVRSGGGNAMTGGSAGVSGSVLNGPMGGVSNGSKGKNLDGRMGASRTRMSTVGMGKARESVMEALAARSDNNLMLDQMIQFPDGFYALIREKNTGMGAMELIVDPATGAVASGFGPTMMWNQKYGPGLSGGSAPTAMRVGSADARAIVLRYLASQGNRKSYDLSVDEFPGYYTIDLSKDGKIAGMASVNASTGEIYFRDWESSSVTR